MSIKVLAWHRNGSLKLLDKDALSRKMSSAEGRNIIKKTNYHCDKKAWHYEFSALHWLNKDTCLHIIEGKVKEIWEEGVGAKEWQKKGGTGGF